MSVIDALLLGILQGLTEFLPVSSSGHVELGKAILGVDAESNLTFTVVVHGATVLSTIVVFYKDIINVFRGLFAFRWNDASKFTLNIIISMVPVGIAGLFFKDQIESMFSGNLIFVGIMLCVTAAILCASYFVKSSKKDIGPVSAFIIGISQAVAVIPGISRSGSTIVTALLLGVKREIASRFSFLMVIVPIIAANVIDITHSGFTLSKTEILPLASGFISAFIIGMLACKLMVKIVNRGNLIYFAIYCLIIGLASILYPLF